MIYYEIQCLFVFTREPGVTNLSLSASKFTEKVEVNNSSISTFFKNIQPKNLIDPDGKSTSNDCNTMLSYDKMENNEIKQQKTGIARFLTANTESSTSSNGNEDAKCEAEHEHNKISQRLCNL